MSQQTHLALLRYGHDQISEIRHCLVEVYSEVYTESLEEEFHSAERFAQRLDRYSASPGWEAVVGYEGDTAIGYAFGSPLMPGTRWWEDVEPPLTEEFAIETGTRTFALFELMVRADWRGTGAARAIHDELIRHRPEERVTLLVDQTHSRVRARYEEWGYRRIGQQRPFPDAPLYDMMLLITKDPSASETISPV